MKLWKTMTGLFAIGLIVVTSGEKANAEEKKFKFHVAGSSVSSPIDINGDGSRAPVTNLRGRSNLGPLRVQTLTEAKRALSDPTDPGSVIPCQLPNGDPGLRFDLIHGQGVYGFENGEIFFTKVTSGEQCFNRSCFNAQGRVVAGCVVSAHTIQDIIGGSGKFTEASGSLEVLTTATFLFADPSGTFLAIEFDGTGMIMLP